MLEDSPGALVDGELGALGGPGWIDAETGRGKSLFEGGLEEDPSVRDVDGVKLREAGERDGEVVLKLSVGLDAHEDREPVDGGRDGLGGGAGGVLRINEALDGVRVIGRSGMEGLEAVDEGAGAHVLVRIGGIDGKPVGEGGHVERGDREDVEQALGAPGLEFGLKVLEGGGVVQAHYGVGHAELVLWGVHGGPEVGGHEVPFEVREGLGELKRVVGRGGQDLVWLFPGEVELEELLDVDEARPIEAAERLGEGLEPREVGRVRGRRGRER